MKPIQMNAMSLIKPGSVFESPLIRDRIPLPEPGLGQFRPACPSAANAKTVWLDWRSYIQRPDLQGLTKTAALRST